MVVFHPFAVYFPNQVTVMDKVDRLKIHLVPGEKVWPLLELLTQTQNVMAGDRSKRRQFRPEEFIEVCLVLSELAKTSRAKDDPHTDLLLRLMETDTRGLIPENTPTDADRVMGSFTQIRADIKSLIDHPCKWRLFSLWHERMARFAEANGFYDEAAETQLFLIGHDKNVVVQYAGLFRASVFSFWNSLVGPYKREVNKRLEHVVKEYKDMSDGMIGQYWRECEGPLRVLQAHILARRDVPPDLWAKLNGHVQKAGREDKVFPLADWASLFRAMETQDWNDVLLLIQISRDSEVVVTAQFHMAALRFNADDFVEAAILCEKILATNPAGIHMVQGAAKHLMGKIQKAQKKK